MITIILMGYAAIAGAVLARELRVAGSENARLKAPVSARVIDAESLVDFFARKDFNHVRHPDIYHENSYRDAAVKAVRQYLANPTGKAKPEPAKQTIKGACLWAALWPAWLAVGLFSLFYASGKRQGEQLAEAQRAADEEAAEVEQIKKQEGWA